MEQLIQSSDLFVMQVEMDVYTALKKVEATGSSSLSETASAVPCMFELVSL